MISGGGTASGLGGHGRFLGPDSGAQLADVIRLVQGVLPFFAESAKKDGIANENGLNRRLCRFISQRFFSEGLPYTAQPESMEDESRSNSPAVDIGIHFYTGALIADPPKIAVLEGKCLSSRAEIRRKTEYVYGLNRNGSPCGGIQRFKMSIHSQKGRCGSGLVGYMQTDDFATWHVRINGWIEALAAEKGHQPPWSADERLTSPLDTNRIATCESTVCRQKDRLALVHFWVDLTDCDGGEKHA